MPPEKPHPGQATRPSTRSRNRGPSAGRSEGSLGDSDAYSSLLRQYGEAMFRIGQLEARIERLTGDPAERAPDEQGPPSQVQNVSDEVEDPEHPSMDHEPEGVMEPPSPVGASSDSDKESAEIAQLRLQLYTLANQLAQAQEELDRVQGKVARHRSHRRNRSRSRWKFWRRWTRR